MLNYISSLLNQIQYFTTKQKEKPLIQYEKKNFQHFDDIIKFKIMSNFLTSLHKKSQIQFVG